MTDSCVTMARKKHSLLINCTAVRGPEEVPDDLEVQPYHLEVTSQLHKDTVLHYNLSRGLGKLREHRTASGA